MVKACYKEGKFRIIILYDLGDGANERIFRS